MKLQGHLVSASQRLAQAGDMSSNARLEAEILLAHVLETPRSFLYAHGDLELPHLKGAEYLALVKRRLQGEPIAYLTGRKEFWSLPLEVNPEVLIPRPETELLVEAALARLPADQVARVADVGTGSGAIALAIASERPESEVHATDISQPAAELAHRNAQALGLLNLTFHVGSWCKPLTGHFDLLVSNPPYVAQGDPHLMQGDCRFEPGLALSPGTNPLIAFETISQQATEILAPGGWLLFEHGLDQGQAVREVLASRGFREVDTLQDLEDRDRVSLGRLTQSSSGLTSLR